MGYSDLKGMSQMKKPPLKKSEMHGDLPFKEGTVVSASRAPRRGVIEIPKKGENYGKTYRTNGSR